MFKLTKYLFLVCLTLFTTNAHASDWAERERLTKQDHLETLTSIGRFQLPQKGQQVVTELDLMEKVYSASDKNNSDLQAMLEKFKGSYQTVSQFEEVMKKTVYDQGPQAGHLLIMEFAYVLMAFEVLQYSSEQNPLWGYYYSLVKTAAIRISRPGLDESRDDMRNLEDATYQVLSKVECLFEQDRNRSLSEALQYANQWAKGWAKENKLKSALIHVDNDTVIINTHDISSILGKIPTKFTSLESKKTLNNEAALLLLNKLATCEQLNALKLYLEDPSADTLQAVIKFLKGKRALKNCKIEYSELCRMDAHKYESIQELDRVLLYMNPRNMD